MPISRPIPLWEYRALTPADLRRNLELVGTQVKALVDDLSAVAV